MEHVGMFPFDTVKVGIFILFAILINQTRQKLIPNNYCLTLYIDTHVSKWAQIWHERIGDHFV